VVDFKKYSSLDNIRKSSEVLVHDVVCLEKIHGSNLSARWTEEEDLVLHGRNRLVYFNGEKTKFDGHGFSDWMLEDNRWEGLKKYPGYIYYGEFMGPGIQKGITYCDHKDWRVFDIRHPDGYFVNWDNVEVMCIIAGFKTVPVLYKGKIDSIDQLNDFVNRNSETAILNGVNLKENLAEGIVVKPYNEVRDKRGNRIIVKYKSEKWQESNSSRVKKQLSPEDVELHTKCREFAEQVCTPGRLATIVEHITRDGNTEISMKRTGDFLKEFVKDVMEEYSEMYSSLDRKEANQYNKTVSGYASNLWKKYVMEN